ncbi:MAG: PQQ-binding-like beta-propeller repeat protein [Solirubrobacteraceae bacterium]
MPTAAWPMLLHDPRHTGCSANFGPATFSTGWQVAALGGFSGIAIDAAGHLIVATATGTVACLSASGTQEWKVTIPGAFTAGPPTIGPSGKLYVANGDVIALDPQTSGGEVWKYARTTPYTIVTAPLALGASETVYALTSTSNSGQPNRLLAISAGVLSWSLTLPQRSNSTPAVGADGTLYLGCDDGYLRAVSSAGVVLWTWAADGKLVGPPALGADGTVYIAVQAPLTQNNALVALTPPVSPSLTPTVRWRYSPDPGEYLSAFGGPAIAPDGTIYIGFHALHALNPDGTKRWATPTTASEISPGAPAVGIDGAVYFVSAAGTLWAYDASGTELWSTALGAGPQPFAPALGANGAVYAGDGQGTLKASVAAAPLGTRLAAIYAGLVGARTPTGTGGQWNYPLNASSIADAPVLALVQAALGAQSGSLTAAASGLRIQTGTIVLTGTTSSFLGRQATVTLTFGATQAGNDVTLALSATLDANVTLPQMLPALAGTLFDNCSFTAASFTQSSSTAQPTPPAWGMTASTNPYASASPLGESARLLALATGNQAVSGTIGAGALPAVSLKVGEPHTLSLTNWTSLSVSLWLETSVTDATEGTLLASVALYSSLTIANQEMKMRAEAPREPGFVVFDAAPTNALPIGLSDLALWGGATQTLPKIVPESMRAASTKFGLKQVRVGFLTNCAVQWVGFTLGAPDWQALSAGSVGMDLAVREVGLEIVCSRPFEEPTLSATLSGKIVSTIVTQTGPASKAEFAIRAIAPDFQIYGSLVAGTIKLQDVLAAMSGNAVTLPSRVPAPVVDEIELYAEPLVGAFSLDLAGDLKWALFEIGTTAFGVSDFGISVKRLQTKGDLTHPAIAATLTGRFDLGGVSFEMIGESPAGTESWDLRANLTSPVAFPTIGEIVGTFNPAWANALPPQVALAGQNIGFKELTASADQAPSTHRAVKATIGTLSGWGGWIIITSPVRLELTAVEVQLSADSASGFSGSLQSAISVGASGKIALTIALPWSSGSFTVKYQTGNEGLTLPSVSELVTWLVPSLSLPDSVASMGGLNLQTFSLTVQVTSAQTTIDLIAKALDASHQWVIVGGGDLPQVALQDLAVSAHRDASTSNGSIAAMLILGGNGIPLKAAMKDSWATYTVGLDTSVPMNEPPSIANIISAISPALAAALPSDLRDLAKEIAVTQFQVAVTPAGTTLSAAVGAKSHTAEWHPIALLPQFRIQALAVEATASSEAGVPTGAAVLGTIAIGANGHIPLRAAVSTSSGTFSLTLDPAGGTATMPTLGDLASLVSKTWEGMLPSQLANLGSTLQLSTFALESTPSSGAWSIDVEVSTDSSWSGYQPVPAFTGLTLLSASASLKSGSGSTPTVGKITCAALIANQQVTFTLTLPGAVFTATLTTEVTLMALAQYLIGTSAVLPAWLEKIGLPEIVAEADFRQNIYALAAVLAKEIPLPSAGMLKLLSLEGRVSGTSAATICLVGVWETAQKVEIPGRICYPFETFVTIGEKSIEKFPREGPPDNTPPPTQEVKQIVEALLAAGATASAAAAIAYFAYNATAAATGAALLGKGITLAATAAALANTWRLGALDLAKTLLESATTAGTTITAPAMAAAIASAYANTLTAGEVATALVCAPYVLTATEMVGALKAAPFTPATIAPVIKTSYAPIDAAGMVAALKTGWQPQSIDARTLVGALAIAPYDPTSAAAPFHNAYPTETGTGAQFATFYVGAGFTPALTAQTLATAMAAAPYTAIETISGLQTAFPQQIQSGLQAVPYLYGAGYSAQQVVGALVATVPQATDMASALHGGGYSAPQAGVALAQGYPTQLPDAPALLALLSSTWSPLSLADAATALAATTFTPQAVGVALRANSTYAPQLDTATKLATVLHNAYGTALVLPDMLLALAACTFPAYASAAATVALYPTPSAASVATALLAAYPLLSTLPLGAALAASSFGANEIRAGILAVAPQTLTGLVTAVTNAVCAATFAATLSTADAARSTGKSAASAARELVVATPTLDPDVLVAAIDAVYMPPAPVLAPLGLALVPAYATPAVSALACALLLASAAAAPSELAVALAGGFGSTQTALTPNDLASALVAAYARIGAPTAETPVAQALVAAFASHPQPLTPIVGAEALKHAFPATSPSACLSALAASFSLPDSLPPSTVAAVAQALAIQSTAPLALTQAMAGTYQLNRCPIAVGTAGLAMRIAGFKLIAVSAAFGQVLQNWDVSDYGTLLNVYQEPAQWTAAWTAASSRSTAADAVQTLNTQFNPGAPRLVTLVVAAYNLIDPVDAATPIATGFKRLQISESNALAALQGFFGGEWTAAATQAVKAVYAQTTHHERM